MTGYRSLVSRLALGMALAAALPAAIARAADAKPADKAPPKTYEVETHRDVAYYGGPDAHRIKHKLDLFVPKGGKDYPLLLFVHGGGWIRGDKNFLGIYTKLGKFWAARGVGVIVPNYRLTPTVQHPGHVQDVARAFGWVERNIRKYGGNPEQVIVCGHSAGAHLAALLVTDDKYLKAEKVDLKAVKGVIPMSGVYEIPAESFLFDRPFGKDPALRKDASPVAHARPGLPPFLVIYADSELPYCGKDSAEPFCQALRAKQCAVRSLQVKDRNHMSLIVNASKEGDPVAKAFQEFMDAQLRGGPKVVSNEAATEGGGR